MAFRFGPYRLDPDTGELTRDGEPLELQPLGHELLELLLHNPGTLFRREELQSALWPGVTVGDDALTMLVSRTRKALGDRKVIETVPRRGYRLAIEVVEEDEAPPGPSPVGPTVHRAPAPPPDRFVGRADALEALDRRFDTARWVTLTGPGGTGKTRLALEWLARRPDGGLFVDGSAADDADGLTQAVATALELPSSAADVGLALQALGRRVLVLDNLEQVTGAGALLADWLAGAPELAVLATSRVVLGARGETVLPVDPLPLAHARALFLAREPRLADDPDLDALVEALDGLPLALELLAPRSRLLSAGRLLELLDDRLTVLRAQGTDRPQRHRSLQAVLDGSWVLLPQSWRDALVALAAFRAPFSLDDVEALVPDGLEALQRLVDHSLVHRRPHDRFGLLFTVRDYVWEQASEARRTEVQWALARHLARLGADEARRGMQADPTGPLTRTAEAALPDLRAATAFAADQGDAGLVAPLALATWQVMRRTGPFEGASQLLDRAIAVGSPPFALLHAAGQAAQLAGRRAHALELHQALLDLAIAGDSPRDEVIARIQRVHHEVESQNLDVAEDQARGALEVSRRAGDRYYEAVAHALLAGIARRRDQPLRAAEHSETAARLYADLPHAGLGGLRQATLGLAHRDRGQSELAVAHFREALQVYAEDGDRFRVVETLEILAEHHHDQGETGSALHAATEALDEARLLGNPRTLVRMLLAVGRLLAAQGHADPARARLSEAHELARRRGLTELADEARAELAKAPAAG